MARLHIKDHAILFDYPDYLEKITIAKQLNLDVLEKDTSNTEIRIWTIAAIVNPQTIFFLKKTNNNWTITKLQYYLSFKDTIIKVDSIATREGNKRTIISYKIAVINKLCAKPFRHVKSRKRME